MDTTLDTQLDQLDTAVGDTRRMLLGVDVGGCDVQQLGRLRKLVLGLRNTLDGVNADLARRAAELRKSGNSRPADDAMNPDGRQSSGEERTERERGDAYDELPDLGDATKAGELSGRYGDIVARAVRHLSGEVRDEFYRRHQDLADTAKAMSEHRFRLYVQMLVEQVLADCGVQRATRQRRNRQASTWTGIDDGMWNLRGAWDPDTGARINSVLEAEINALYHTARDNPDDQRTRPQILADAVANLLCGNPTSNQTRKDGGATVLVITNQLTANTTSTSRGSGTTNPSTQATKAAATTSTSGAAGITDSATRTLRAETMSEPTQTATGGGAATDGDVTGETITDGGLSQTGATGARARSPGDLSESTPAEHANSSHPDAAADDSVEYRLHEYSNGTPVALLTLRQLLDDPATVTVPVMVNQHGVVTAVGDTSLNQGRHRRFATSAQRLALRAMHRSCLIPGCDIPFDACEIHHLVEWEHNGTTDLHNLAPLCVRHHHLVHAEGWILQLDPTTRQLTITQPDGTTDTHPFNPLTAPDIRRPIDGPSDQTSEPDHPPPGRRPPADQPLGGEPPDQRAA